MKFIKNFQIDCNIRGLSMFSKSTWNMFFGFWITILVLFGLIVGLIFVFPGYHIGYKKGQLDYQRGIIKYEIQEVTTDIIRRLK